MRAEKRHLFTIGQEVGTIHTEGQFTVTAHMKTKEVHGFHPQTSHLGINSKETIRLVNEDICTRNFIPHNLVDNSCLKMNSYQEKNLM